jgi:NitT/TauT family transport system substrate-binding protein
MLIRSLFTLFAIAIAGSAAAQPLEKLTVRLDFVPWGAHAPFHLAAQKGWFKEAGLDVDMQDGNGSVTTIQLIGANNFDVGHASLAPMIIARSKGLSIRAIANFVRKNDIGLMVSRGSGIKSPKDLVGKQLIFTAGSFESPFIDSFLAAGGVNRSQLELLNVDASSKAGAYMAGRSDGVITQVPWLLVMAAERRPSEAILFADYGLNFPSFGLIAHEDTIKKKPAALKRFASVIAGAWTYIYAGGQQEAANAMVAQRPQAKINADNIRQQVDALRPFFETPGTKALPVGVMSPEDWAAALKTMAAAGLIQGGDAAQFYTNDLLDTATISRIGARAK